LTIKFTPNTECPRRYCSPPRRPLSGIGPGRVAPHAVCRAISAALGWGHLCFMLPVNIQLSKNIKAVSA
jgi:hypothetical protein